MQREELLQPAPEKVPLPVPAVSAGEDAERPLSRADRRVRAAFFLLCCFLLGAAGAAVLAGLALEVICCNLVLKPLIAWVHPCDVNTAVQLLVARPDDFSFPSGHTGASFAAVTALYAGGNRLWIPALLLAALISFSRLYLYVHYPTDVLAGILLGAAAGWLGSQGIACVGGKLHHGL